jgi:peroxiredoxin Q/BCP
VSEPAPDVELPNPGAGPDPLSLAELARRDQVDAIVLVFQRDDYCLQCRSQVQDLNDRYAEFTTRDAWIVSVLPEDRETARAWVERYELMYPLLADPDGVAADAYDQPTRFGTLGEAVDLIGRLPQALVLDTREADLRHGWAHEGTDTGDRPTVDELLDAVTQVTGNEGVDPEEFERRA